MCQKEELANYECLLDKENEASEDLTKVGWTGKPMRIRPPDDYEQWRKVYLRGLEMRRNIISGNFEGWRIYANRYIKRHLTVHTRAKPYFLSKNSPKFDA